MLLTEHPKITTIVCELPSNIKFSSPNLERIRYLADYHGLIVACDETTGNFINIDVRPFVDVVLSSLTKMFSGASNVTGGRFGTFLSIFHQSSYHADFYSISSVVVNPNSRHHDRLRSQIADQDKTVVCFPTR